MALSKMQAAMRDNAAKKWKQNKNMKLVSSVFKGCAHCGEWEMRPTKSGGEYKHWHLPGEVYEAYTPSDMGWTHWCYMCGAKDSKAWGKAEIELRETPVRMTTAAKIDELQVQLDELMAKIKGVK